MTPLADAMRFINRDQTHWPFLQVRQKARQHQTLRRDVQQTVFVISQSEQARAHFTRFERGVKKRRRHATRRQRVNLILHQRN